MATRPLVEAGGRQLGRYVLFEAIARGGMATVHFGRLSGPVGFARTVAIKRLHANFATDPEFVAMFLDEARLAARIRHPNVVPTLDVVATDGEVFIVLEYVTGESLGKLWRTLTKTGETLPIPFSLAIVANVLQGLHAAHEVRDEQGEPLGIVHRDVSPQNIIVGTDGVARVLDFGVAKAAGRYQETGDSGEIKGKIAYMAPEQLSGGSVSRQTDVYAAAVVLWELLAGRRLIEGDNDAQRVGTILASVTAGQQVFAPPSQYNARVSPVLDALVLRGLAWPPSARFATAKEMAGELERNGGLVAATEVGDWVTSLAAPALAERAERLHAIESQTDRGNVLPLPEPGSSDTETIAAAPPVFVDESTLPRPRRRARGVALSLFAFGALAAGGFTLATLAWRGRGRPPERPAPVVEQAAAAIAPAPSAGPSVSAAHAAAEASSSALPAPVAIADAAAPLVRSTVKPRPAPHAATGLRVSAAPAPDCDPPYVMDAENHKVYKRECLK